MQRGFLGQAMPLFEKAENGSGGSKPLDSSIRPQEDRGIVSAIRIEKATRSVIIVGEEKSGEVSAGGGLTELRIDATELECDVARGDGTATAKVGLQVSHQQGGGDAFPRDIA
jgi:hypothetical protein